MSHRAEPAIDVQGLTKRFGDFVAVDDLDLSVARGEVFGFLGPNGSGKSTTIRTFLDQIRPTAGSVRIFGLDSTRDSLEVRARVGYVPGDLALYPRLTGRQVLDYFARLRGGVDQRYLDELVTRLGAELDKKISECSTGNRQKIGLVQAFMHRPDLLVLDEPSSGLDPLVQQELHALIGEARDEGRTVFLSTHTLSVVERVADRVGIIRHGRLTAVETIQELRRKAIRRLEMEFAEAPPAELFTPLDGVRDVRVERSRVEVDFDGSINPILAAAMSHELLDLHTADADLEEIFLAYYEDDQPEQDAVAEQRRATADGGEAGRSRGRHAR